MDMNVSRMWRLKHLIVTLGLTAVFCSHGSAGSPSTEGAVEAALDGGGYAESRAVSAGEPDLYCGDAPSSLGRSTLLEPDPQGQDQRAIIGCEEVHTPKPVVKISDDVTFHDLDVRNIDFDINGNDVTLTFVRCDVTNVSITNSVKENIAIQIVNSTMQGYLNSSCVEELECRTSSSVTMDTGTLTIWYWNSRFIQTQQTFTTGSAHKVLIENCTFTNDWSRYPSHEALYLTVDQASDPVTITVLDSVFSRIVYVNPVQSAMNIFIGAVVFRVSTKTRQDVKLEDNKVKLDVRDCVFEQNERALTVIGIFRQINISRCSFIGNEALHAGAAFLSLSDKDTPTYVRECTFRDNIAGSFKFPQWLPHDGSITVHGQDISVNSDCCKGTIRLTGKGGAMRAQRGKVTVTNSTFTNNSASLFGGTFYVDAEASLTLDGVSIENSVHWKTGAGDVILSKGALRIRRAEIRVDDLGDVSRSEIISHAGDHWSGDVKTLYVRCPSGYDVKTENESAYGVTSVGLRRSYLVDSIEYLCLRCPQEQLGPDFGYLNYSVSYDNFAQYTLRIDGNEPDETPKASFIDHHNIQCDRKSGRGLDVEVLECPAGYCAAGDTASNNKCVANRTGILCGECEEGFAQLYYSSDCVENTDCDSFVFWVLYLLLAAAYIVYCIGLAWVTFRNKGQGSRSLEGHRVSFNGDSVEVDGEMDVDVSMTGYEKVFIVQGCSALDLIIILFYYLQDIQLFHAHSNQHLGNHDANKNIYDVMNSVTSLVTRFNWYIISWVTSLCAFEDSSAVGNQVLATFFVPLVIFLLGTLSLVWQIICLKRKSTSSEMGQLLCHALFLTLLLTYQGHLIDVAALLKCVPFLDSNVLFLNGNIPCVQGWQYLYGCYLLLWLVPFWLILISGRFLLQIEQLSLPKYLLLFILPLPFGAYLVFQILSKKCMGNERLVSNQKYYYLVNFLHCSNNKLPRCLQYFCCHGIVVMFRFTMVMINTQSTDVINGMLGVLVVVFVKLMYTTAAQPYSHARSNWASMAGDAALLLVGGTNMGVALLYRGSAEYTRLLKVLLFVDGLFSVWIPLTTVIVGIVIYNLRCFRNKT